MSTNSTTPVHTVNGTSIFQTNSATSNSTVVPNRARKLVRTSRARLTASDPTYYYHQHTLANPGLSVQASETGNTPFTAAVASGFFKENLSIEATDESSEYAVKTASNVSNASNGNNGNNGTKSTTTRQTAMSSQRLKQQQLRKWKSENSPSAWVMYCRLVTFPVLPGILDMCNIKNRNQQQAWREKIGLLSVVVWVTAFVGFFTFGLNSLMCSESSVRVHVQNVPSDSMIIHGRLFNLSTFHHTNGFYKHRLLTAERRLERIDGSFFFQSVNNNCKPFLLPTNNTQAFIDANGNAAWYYPCRALLPSGRFLPQPDVYDDASLVYTNATLKEMTDHWNATHSQPKFTLSHPAYGCHTSQNARDIFYKTFKPIADVYYTWDDIAKSTRRLAVLHSHVIDLDRLWLLEDVNWRLVPPLDRLAARRNYPQHDLSLYMVQDSTYRQAGRCLVELAKVGVIEAETVGCITSHISLYCSLLFIFGTVVLKFVFALYYGWFLSWRMGVVQRPFQRGGLDTTFNDPSRMPDTTFLDAPFTTTPKMEIVETTPGTAATAMPMVRPGLYMQAENILPADLKKVIQLVTIYSEDYDGIKATLDSIAATDYPDSHKLIIAVCDGLVTAAGSTTPTPEIVVGMMSHLVTPPEESELLSYVAVSSGTKRYNMAQIHAGYYTLSAPQSDNIRYIPMICIVKCGPPQERNDPKSGNRGKRDSQLIIMGFLQRIMFEERMTDLENELYLSVLDVTRFRPEDYELILMVDADTVVYPDSMRHMVVCLSRDTTVMGLCGETKISNKTDSWVTQIQVFEYFISHHLTKSFESVFGGVTCLPGCFCMYRIKAPKGNDGFCVPILANPDIIERYSENSVETLHRKNLLLLGEDRYLSTLMLKTFPRRKQVFVSQAKCKTVVPSKFSVLLDQRRRWINSTVHNLFELLLVSDLCGVFCISMQFVVFMELISTATLPAALLFTLYLFATIGLRGTIPYLPIAILVIIAGFPGLLILVSGHRWKYLIWMTVYLVSVPIWNFILPLNAFWRFDDFSWGNTRTIEGEDEGGYDDEKSVGRFDAAKIQLRTVHQYLYDRYPDDYKVSTKELVQGAPNATAGF
ncbi:chitin synthase 3 [Trichomonascus vanleenenianus]|uniref:chitin synthase 3 n=1 Tax=Trichomonascus vanleenenianus TaxID=2268995 RepID=UPI003ECAA17A